jgi:hypothetical protein
MKIFGAEYDTVQPTKTGCDLIDGANSTAKSIEDIQAQIEACRLEIKEREIEKNFLEGIIVASDLMNQA